MPSIQQLLFPDKADDAARQAAILTALQETMDRLCRHALFADAAFDLVLMPQAAAGQWAAVLLDANPLLDVTDHGHYAADAPFDNCLRWRHPVDGQLHCIPLPVCGMAWGNCE